jgi:hypothetical protein
MPSQESWRWCNKCQGLMFVANPSLGPCAAGAQHDPDGSGTYVLVQDDPGISGQREWKWCNKCQGLAFAGNPSAGACPAGGQHDHTGSGNYSLVKDSPGTGQPNWRWCNKCQGLAFAGNPSAGACPAGGEHNHAGSGNYNVVLKESSCWRSRSVSLSAGKIDSSFTIIVKQDGNWQFYGSLHDNSLWYGDGWALGFVLGNSGHGVTTKGSLGAKMSGGAVDGTFNLHSSDPWITQNWQFVSTCGIKSELHVDPDPLSALPAVISDLKWVVALL